MNGNGRSLWGHQAGKAESKSLESKSRQTTVKVWPISLKSWRQKARLNYFLHPPAVLVSLAGSICLPQQFLQTFPVFFKLPTLHLALAPPKRTFTELTEKHSLPSCPHAHLFPAHTPCFPLEAGILTTQSQSPGSHWALSSTGRSSTQHSPTSSARPWAGSFPPQFTHA